MNTLIQLGQLLQAVSQVEGRKRLQKMVHILQEFGVSFDVRFGYHHFGPFSDQLQDSLQSFQHDRLISETPVGGQFPTSQFKAEPELINLLTLVGASDSPCWARFAAELNDKSPRELEAISTLIYVEKQETSFDAEQLQAAFEKLKPNLKDLLPNAKKALADFRVRFTPETLVA